MMQSGGQSIYPKGLEDLQPEPVYPGQGPAAQGDVELTEKEARLMVAVEKADRDAFVRLGGATGSDLNFEVTRDGATPLLIACAKGDLEFVNLMLCNPSLDIDHLDKNGVNAFFVAAYHSNLPVMRRLMEKGANMFQKNSNGSNVLHVAVKRGNLQVLEELIRIQYPLNEPKMNGITALGIAAMRGSVNLLEMLHRSGGDIEQTSPAGIGPLYLAIKARQQECVRYLIDAGASVFLKDPVRVDFSPVFIAVRSGQIPVIEMMCDVGVHIDSFKDSQGYTPLMLAVKLGLHDVVNYLTLRGCDLNQQDPQNRTLLMYYTLYTEDLTANQKDPMSSLKLLDFARRFVSRGADINHTSESSEFGQTLLIQAIRLRKLQTIEFLLDQGANPHICDLAGLDACDHAKKHGLSENYEELSRCNPKLRVQPKHLPGSSGQENAGDGAQYGSVAVQLVTRKQPTKQRDHYAHAYKQLSEELGHDTQDHEVTSSQRQQSPVASRRATFKPSQRTSKETEISMRLDEPPNADLEEQKRSMQRQLKSLKQRAVASQLRESKKDESDTVERKSTGKDSILAIMDQEKPAERPIMTTKVPEGPIIEEEDIPAQGLTDEEVEARRRDLEQKFRQLEYEDGVEKDLNKRLQTNVDQSIDRRNEVSNRLKNQRHKERVAMIKEREHLKSSVLQSISKGDEVTLTDIVLGKKRPPQKSEGATLLSKVLNEDEKEPVLAIVDERMKEVEENAEELEYYQQMQALDHRIKTGVGSDTQSMIIKKSIEGDLSFRRSPQKKREPIFKTAVSIANLRQSKSSSQIGTLQSNFGDLAALRKSRLMLNKHLEERSKAMEHVTRDRKDQHDDFHRAVKNTSFQLDNLTRKMQYDLYRGNNRTVLPIAADSATSMIEHELRKSKLLTEGPEMQSLAKLKPLASTIDQYNAIKGASYRNIEQQSSLGSAGAQVIGGYNPQKYYNPQVQASAYNQVKEPQSFIGLDRVNFPRVRMGPGDQVQKQQQFGLDQQPQHYHVARPYENQMSYPPQAAHNQMAIQPMAPEKPVFVPRSIIDPRPDANRQGIVRDLRLDKIVSNTMSEHRGNIDPLDNYLDLQLRQGPAAMNAAAGGNNGDVSRIIEMQALIEGMARSNQVIMQIGDEQKSVGSRIKDPRNVPRSRESKRSSPSKVSFKLQDDHNDGIVRDINAKLNRLNNQANNFVGKVHQTNRVEQPGLIQPPMKFRRDDSVHSRSSSRGNSSPPKSSNPKVAPIRQRR